MDLKREFTKVSGFQNMKSVFDTSGFIEHKATLSPYVRGSSEKSFMNQYSPFRNLQSPMRIGDNDINQIHSPLACEERKLNILVANDNDFQLLILTEVLDKV